MSLAVGDSNVSSSALAVGDSDLSNPAPSSYILADPMDTALVQTANNTPAPSAGQWYADPRQWGAFSARIQNFGAYTDANAYFASGLNTAVGFRPNSVSAAFQSSFGTVSDLPGAPYSGPSGFDQTGQAGDPWGGIICDLASAQDYSAAVALSVQMIASDRIAQDAGLAAGFANFIRVGWVALTVYSGSDTTTNYARGWWSPRLRRTGIPFATTQEDAWHVCVPRSNMLEVGTVDWANVTKIGVHHYAGAVEAGLITRPDATQTSAFAAFSAFRVHTQAQRLFQLQSDDGGVGNFTLGRDIYNAYNAKVQQNVYTDGAGTGGTMSLANMATMESEGHRLALHPGASSASLTQAPYQNAAGWTTEVADARAALAGAGVARTIKGGAYPGGIDYFDGGNIITTRAHQAAVAAGLQYMRRSTLKSDPLLPGDRPWSAIGRSDHADTWTAKASGMALGLVVVDSDLGNQAGEPVVANSALPDLVDDIADSIAGGGVFSFLWHNVVAADTGSSPEITTARVTALLDALLAAQNAGRLDGGTTWEDSIDENGLVSPVVYQLQSASGVIVAGLSGGLSYSLNGGFGE